MQNITSTCSRQSHQHYSHFRGSAEKNWRPVSKRMWRRIMISIPSQLHSFITVSQWSRPLTVYSRSIGPLLGLLAFVGRGFIVESRNRSNAPLVALRFRFANESPHANVESGSCVSKARLLTLLWQQLVRISPRPDFIHNFNASIDDADLHALCH
jgi:hypothetical protein